MNIEKQLLSLINATKVLTSTRNLDEVLHLIIKEALSVFYWADAIVLFLYDSSKGHLRAESSIGFDINYLKNAALKPDEAMSGKTFLLREAQLYTSEAQTGKGMSNITNENYNWYKKALGEDKVPTSTISAPLMSKNECYGVLTIDSYSEEVKFTMDNLKLLQTFANQAMIAIENATLISQNNRSNHIHKELTKVYMSNQGLSEITKTLSRLTDKQFCVCNEFLDVLSYTSQSAKDILVSLMEGETISVSEIFSEENVTHQRVVFNEQSYDLHFFAIVIESEITGLLAAVTEENNFLDSLDIFAVEQATTVFALEVQSHNQYVSSQFQYEGHLIEKIIKNPEQGNKYLQLKNLYKKSHQYVVLTIEMAHEMMNSKQIHKVKQSFSRLLYRHLNSFQHRFLVKEEAMQYSILFIMDECINEEEINKQLIDFMSNLKKKINYTIYAGVGRSFRELKDLSYSLNDARKCIEFLRMTDYNKEMITYVELGGYRLFLNLDPEEMDSFVKIRLQKIIDYDIENNSDLVKTLKLYLYFNKNIRKTSEKMYVHENTIKYRINKAKQLMEIKELDGDLTFEINLAIKMITFQNRYDLLH